MFEPDTLLPEQYFTLLGRKPLQGEKRLLLAMLEDAVHCFQTYLLAKKPTSGDSFRKPRSGLFPPMDSGFFSFENICDVLGINPGRMRKRSRRGKRSKRSATRGTAKPWLMSLSARRFLSAPISDLSRLTQQRMGQASP